MSAYRLSHDGRMIVPYHFGAHMDPAEALRQAARMEAEAAELRALVPQAEANVRAYEDRMRADVEAAVAKGATAHGLAAFRVKVGHGGWRSWVRVAGDVRAPEPPPPVNFGRVHDGRIAHLIIGDHGQAFCGENYVTMPATPGKHRPCGVCWQTAKDRRLELPPVAEGAP